ncbi:protein DPCD-like [Argonauta hians]
MATLWLEKLKSSQKSCITQDGRIRVHYNFNDGSQMAEEYEQTSKLLLVRKWRHKRTLGDFDEWKYEVGESMVPVPQFKDLTLRENINNPIFIRLDIKEAFQWRIRNLPYPPDTYDITLDEDKQNVVVRTTNKKYYKKFSIPDMTRLELPLNKDAITFSHINNTLIISYKKPKEVLSYEKEIQNELKKVKSSGDNVANCQPS